MYAPLPNFGDVETFYEPCWHFCELTSSNIHGGQRVLWGGAVDKMNSEGRALHARMTTPVSNHLPLLVMVARGRKMRTFNSLQKILRPAL